jgi:hypothetical protein
MIGVIYRVQDRPENLGNASQGIILLNLMLEYFNINRLVVIVR